MAHSPRFDLAATLQYLATHNPGRTEADIQSAVRDLLVRGDFDISVDDVHLEAQTSERGRIDVETGAVLIECKKNLGSYASVKDGEDQLAGYLLNRENTKGQPYVGILTDGVNWRCYRSEAGTVSLVSTVTVNAQNPDAKGFRWWIGAILATEHQLEPTRELIHMRLGSNSPAFCLTEAQLRALWKNAVDNPAVRLKRTLWSRLLRTALGTQFDDDDLLFIGHTYLVLLATLIGHAVLGYDLPLHAKEPSKLLSGDLISEAEITGVGDAGFFNWPLDVEGGNQLVRDLARRVSAFDWSNVDHDVLKVLYESVIQREVRHRLGEYYTPDWLAKKIVRDVVTQPLSQRVLDPACGSGTFLFWAIRHYQEAAAAANIPIGVAVCSVPNFVFGIDLHPVAVTLAQVTYLLALGRAHLQERSAGVNIPVYLGDSMQWNRSQAGITEQDDAVVISTVANDDASPGRGELRFPMAVVADVTRFDQLISELTQKASGRKRGGGRPSIKGALERHKVAEVDRPAIEHAYSALCDLFDDGRDHVWGFYVRNQARPSWFSLPENRVEVLIGNPPWLAYRHMPTEMQARFKMLSKARGLWAGGKVATHQDLSAFFVARATELFLQVNGHFGFVMPRAVLVSRPDAISLSARLFSSIGYTTAAATDPRPCDRRCFAFSSSLCLWPSVWVNRASTAMRNPCQSTKRSGNWFRALIGVC